MKQNRLNQEATQRIQERKTRPVESYNLGEGV